MNEIILNFILFVAGGMVGLILTSLLAAGKHADMQRQIGELIEENVHLKSRGRKPKPKRKPTRRRNA